MVANRDRGKAVCAGTDVMLVFIFWKPIFFFKFKNEVDFQMFVLGFNSRITFTAILFLPFTLS